MPASLTQYRPLTKWCALLLMATLFLFSMSELNAQKGHEKLRKQIERLADFDTSIDPQNTHGYIVGIMDGDFNAIISFGTRSASSTDTITASDIFPVGSVSKIHTAVLLTELDRKGLLPLSTQLDSLLPRDYSNSALSEFTIRDFLSHQTGLPRDPFFDGDFGIPEIHYPEMTREQLLNEYAAFDGAKNVVYSNFSYAVIQVALEYYFDSAFGQIINDHLLVPERIYLAGDDLSIQGFTTLGEEAEVSSYGVFTASGGLACSASDLLQLLNALDKSASFELWKQTGPGLNEHMKMGLGWHIFRPSRKCTVYAHTGRTLGHTAFIGYVPETHTAAVVLCNSAHGTDDLGMEILRIMNDNWKRKGDGQKQ